MFKFESNFEKTFYNLHSIDEVAQNRKDKRDLMGCENDDEGFRLRLGIK